MDYFMKYVFSKEWTNASRGYFMIHPKFRVSCADVWRYIVYCTSPFSSSLFHISNNMIHNLDMLIDIVLCINMAEYILIMTQYVQYNFQIYYNLMTCVCLSFENYVEYNSVHDSKYLQWLLVFAISSCHYKGNYPTFNWSNLSTSW